MKKGFTLIEILVSLFFLTLVMTSFVSVVVISMRSFRAARAQYLGSKIAEDGIELVVNKRDNNILCIKPGTCSQLCSWKQGLLYTPGASCNLQTGIWNVDATKPDQLLAGNWFDNYNSSSHICVKTASQNKFGICTTEAPITGNYNRKVTITDVPGLEAVNVQSTVTWTANGAPSSITLEEILFGINGPAGGGGGSDMVGWWKMDDGTGSLIAADSSGNGNDGMLNGPTWIAGVINGALSFDGINDRIDINKSNSLNNLDVKTISLWSYVTEPSWGGQETLFDKQDSGTSGWRWTVSPISSTDWRFNYYQDFQGGGGRWRSSASTVPVNQWTHFVVIYDRTSTTNVPIFYVNGSVVGVGAITNPVGNAKNDSSVDVHIGDRSAGDSHMQGKIDDVRIFNRALSTQEILNLYNASVPDTVPPSVPTGLTATAVSYSQINLSWNDSTDNKGVTGYKVERCQGTGCSSFVEIAAPSSTTYSDTGLTSNTTYRYRVRATDAALNLSGYSSIASATTQVLSCSTIGSNAFYGCYYNDASPGAFSTLVAARADTAINFNWDAGSPDPSVSSNLFSARWTGDFNFNAGDYIFTATSNDGIRFYIDGVLTAFDQGNGWVDQNTATTYTATHTMTAGTHRIKIEYYENIGQASAQFSWGQPTPGLVGWWRLDDGTGSLIAADSSGHGNTGILANGPAWTTAGQIGGALSFDGSDDRVNLGSPATLDNLQQKTISLWVKYPSAGSIDIPDLVDKQDGGSSGWRLRLNSVINGSDLRLRFIQNFSGTSGDWSSNSSTVPYDSWVHVVVAYDKTNAGNQPTFYVNGSPVGSGAITSPAGTASDDSAVNAYIGDRFASDNSFKGSLDDVRIYNGTLSVAEIQTIYDAGASPSAPVNLIATSVSSSQINLSWIASTDNVGVAGYKVERCQGSGCSSYAQIATHSGISYGDTGLSAGTTYRYRVRAYDATGNNSDYSQTASATTQPAVGLAGWWKFDGIGADTIAIDDSGNLNNGTLCNGAACPQQGPTWTPGIVGTGNALIFDGINDYVNAGDIIDTGTTWTASAWIKVANNSTNPNYILGKCVGGCTMAPVVLLRTNGTELAIVDGAGSIRLTGLNVLIGQWNHVAVTVSGTTLKGYINGIEGSPKTMVAGGNNNFPMIIGAKGDKAYFFKGSIDDARVYNRVLTPSEIQALCNMGNGGCPVAPSLISQSQMSIASADSEQSPGNLVTNAIDGNTASIWHTQWTPSSPTHPHQITLNLGGSYSVVGLKYLPRQNGQNGTIISYNVYVSTDGVTWGSAVAGGSWAADITEKTASFSPKTGSFVRLVANSEWNGNPWTSAAEINIMKQ